MEEVFIKTKEAAKFMCVSMSKLTKMCHKKEVPYYKSGRLNVFKKEELKALIEKNRVYSIYELKAQAEANLMRVAS